MEFIGNWHKFLDFIRSFRCPVAGKILDGVMPGNRFNYAGSYALIKVH